MSGHAMNIHIETEMPEQLARQTQALGEQGWASDINALIVEAVRRCCETHQGALTEAFLREDVQWGLHGDD